MNVKPIPRNCFDQRVGLRRVSKHDINTLPYMLFTRRNHFNIKRLPTATYIKPCMFEQETDGPCLAGSEPRQQHITVTAKRNYRFPRYVA